jgi:glycosyltransferase involved in cell wall biosynthesis
MRIAILTNEYPPNVYGGAGVHVEYLTRELSRLGSAHSSVEVICFGDQRIESGNLRVQGVEPDFALPYDDPKHRKFLDTMLKNLVMAGMTRGVDVVHCHTWYTHLAGCLIKQP